MINLKAYESLPTDLQAIVKTTALRYHNTILAEFEAKNNFYLKKLIEEGAQLREFPEGVIQILREKSELVLSKIILFDNF
jgi:TRAP-type mannitol/chloroaromatic compound transport system substrate-binding protein